jgi:hypothetical protein
LSDRLRAWLVLIAAVYVGFAVVDGRASVIVVESCVAAGFVVLAAAELTAVLEHGEVRRGSTFYGIRMRRLSLQREFVPV